MSAPIFHARLRLFSALEPAPALMQRALGAALVPRLLRALEHTLALRLGAAVVPSLEGRADRACGPIR